MPAQRKPVAISTMARMTVGTADSQACSLSAAGLFGRGLCLSRGIFHRTTCPSATPPSVGLVAGGLCTFLAMPLLIQAFKKPRWKLQTKAENSV